MQKACSCSSLHTLRAYDASRQAMRAESLQLHYVPRHAIRAEGYVAEALCTHYVQEQEVEDLLEHHIEQCSMRPVDVVKLQLKTCSLTHFFFFFHVT